MSKIEVVEVGPRDGFQSVRCAAPIASELKLEVIDKLIAAGVKHMEYTSFVSPKAIPQLADAQTVTEAVMKKYPGLDLFALVPNLRVNSFFMKYGQTKNFGKNIPKVNICKLFGPAETN